MSNVVELTNTLIDMHGADTQPSTLIFPFQSDKRQTIDYFPLSYLSDTGVSLRAMSDESEVASQTILKNVLSEKGYRRTQLIQSLEDELRNGVPESESNRLSDNYAMQLFGNPSVKTPWSLKYEGHHLSLNFTFINGLVRGTPLFLGGKSSYISNRITRAEKATG